MEVSMDGLRHSLTTDFNTLGVFLDSIVKDSDHYIDSQELQDLYNQVAQYVGCLNCTMDNDNDSFNDLSEELDVMRLGDE